MFSSPGFLCYQNDLTHHAAKLRLPMVIGNPPEGEKRDGIHALGTFAGLYPGRQLKGA